MATVTPKLDTRRQLKNGTYPIIIRVIDGNKVKNIPVKYKVAEKFWKDGRVSSKHPDADMINGVLEEKLKAIKAAIATAHKQNKKIEIESIGKSDDLLNFCAYLRHRAKQYEEKEQIIMRRKIVRFVKELNMCFGRDLYFSDVTADNLRVFENWLVQERKNSNNTRAKKFKFLRQFYEHAIREGRTSGANPFRNHQIARTPVKNDKLTENEIESLENVALEDYALRNARNLFLFSYYCKGARFENCITMPRSAIRNGRIYFQSNKGKDHISVKLHSKLQKTFASYTEGDFLFPYISSLPETKKEYIRLIDSLNTIVNWDLKKVAKECDIKTNLTFHMARHSFAYHLKRKGVGIHVIKDSLGHGDAAMTEVYLKSLEDEAIDDELSKLYGE